MKPADFIAAARVPESLKPQVFGLWSITRVSLENLESDFEKFMFLSQVGFRSQTALRRASWKTLHLEQGEVVMEDSLKELSTHLPIWLKAKGKVLITGLGLGCVVRGLLASPDVEHITVVEIDPHLLRVVGHEFRSNRRVELIQGDALKVFLPGRFDYAWHDLWTDGDRHLQVLHADLIKRFHKQVKFQGAWRFPRFAKRRMPNWLLQ